MAGKKKPQGKTFDFKYYLKSDKESKIRTDACAVHEKHLATVVISSLLQAQYGDVAVLLSYRERD